jgi:hypothetical protein
MMATHVAHRIPTPLPTQHTCCFVRVKGRPDGKPTSWAEAVREAERWIAAGLPAELVEIARPGKCLSCVIEQALFRRQKRDRRRTENHREKDVVSHVKHAMSLVERAKRMLAEAGGDLDRAMQQRPGGPLEIAMLESSEHLATGLAALGASAAPMARVGIAGVTLRERVKPTLGELRKDLLYRCSHCERTQAGSPLIWHQARARHLADEHMIHVGMDDEEILRAHYGAGMDPDEARGEEDEDDE